MRSRPATTPPSPVITVPPWTNGTGVAGLGARHASAKDDGTSVSAVALDPAALDSAALDPGTGAVVKVVCRASLVHHSALDTASTATANTAVTITSNRLRRSGAGIRPRSVRGAGLAAVLLLGCAVVPHASAATSAAPTPTARSGISVDTWVLDCGRDLAGS